MITPHQPTKVLWWILGFFGLLMLWAVFFEIDQTVRAMGQVMTSTRTQVIQAADGGVLEKLMVREGQTIKAGQSLAILEKDRANAGVEESYAKSASLQVVLVRAKAESTGVPLRFPKDLLKYKEFIVEQTALYDQKKKSIEMELMTLQESLQMAEQELRMNDKLFKAGDISQLDLMRAKRQVLEFQSKIDTLRNKYKQDAINEAAKVQEELMTQKFKLQERRSVLDHTLIKSPVDGVVKSLKLNTVGGVLRPGDELMQISPTRSELIIEAKVNPADVGQLREGLPATVKIDAFDYTIHGSLTGTLTHISSDTLTESGAAGQSNLYYRAQISLDSAQVNKKLAWTDLKPGMTASVDIRTGYRSILGYIFKPVAKAFEGAGSQR